MNWWKRIVFILKGFLMENKSANIEASIWKCEGSL